MKRIFFSLSTVFFLFIFSSVSSQIYNSEPLSKPFYNPSAPIFGKDIIINDQPDQNQGLVAVCSAFNGWLYAAYTYPISTLEQKLSILRSEDNGITWEILKDAGTGHFQTIFTNLDILTTGNCLENLKVFISWSFYDTINYRKTSSLLRFNGLTMDYEWSMMSFNGYTPSISITNDIDFQSNKTDYNSLAVLYSKNKFAEPDSIVLRASHDGGITFDTYKGIAATNDHFDRVALAYGYSQTLDSGFYYAVWELKLDESDEVGYIYASRIGPGLSGSFTLPVCLDCNIPSISGKVRKPLIAGQYGNGKNNMLDLTEVILFESLNTNTGNYDIFGMYNLQSTSTDTFQPFVLNTSQERRIQPSVFYNPYDSTFNITYFDSTALSLPYIINNMNLTNPDIWDTVTFGYNDEPVLSNPNPRGKININDQKGMFTWISDGQDMRGIAMFDAVNSTYTDINDILTNDSNMKFGSYPIPCTDEVRIWFEIKNDQRVIIKLFDLYGRQISMLTDNYFTAGKHVIMCDVSGYSAGGYYYTISANKHTGNGKILLQE